MGPPSSIIRAAPALVLTLIFVGALALRLPRLEQRPLHGDEAVNALKFRGLWDKGVYRYDPHEFHGPTLPFLTVLPAAVSGHSKFNDFSPATFRALAILFGAALILLIPLLSGALPKPAQLWAAAFTALSPAMVFYSRYYIHEMLLVSFTFLFLCGLWRFWQRPNAGWAALSGLALGAMHSTKETFVLPLIAMMAAAVLLFFWRRFSGAPPLPPAPIRLKHLILAIACAAAVSLLLFSSFFSHATGPLDSIRTYFIWLDRAAGNSPHAQPWHFYFKRLFWMRYEKGPSWSEAIILIFGLLGLVSILREKNGHDRSIWAQKFLALYTVLLTLIYSALRYKTPWCALGFLHGWILLAGIGAARALSRLTFLAFPASLTAVGATLSPSGLSSPLPLGGEGQGEGARQSRSQLPLGSLAISLLLLLGLVHLGWQAWAMNFRYAVDRKNPHVYAHTSPDLLNLVQRVEELAKLHSDQNAVPIKVMAPDGDYWPLPWYLRRFTRVGWWSNLDRERPTPIMIVSSKFEAELDQDKQRLMAGYFQLRPEVFFELYVDLELWRKFIESRPKPPPEPEEEE